MNHRRRFVLRPLLFACGLFALCPFAAFGQSASATLSGTVVDERGAVIPGAQVTVTNPSTTLERQVVTNESGFFTVPLLPPATYTVSVQSTGFAPVKVLNVVVNVGDQKALNIQLKVGQVGAVVDVKSDASLVNESPAVATTVDRQFVENIPLNGRSFQSLFELTPGVVLTKANADEPGQFSVNGQRANTNYFTVDGVSANIGIGANATLDESGSGTLPGFSVLGGTGNLVSVDALQEFKIQTSSFAPEFGRTPGAQISIVTRTGTNNFHGSLFEDFRNDAFDATDWFANNRGLKKPPLRQIDFGGVVGGPLFFPRFGEGGPALYNGRNRTFFFFSYEGLRLRQPKVGISHVPSLQIRQSAPVGIQPFLNAYPIPNGRNLGNNAAEFSASFSNPSTLNSTSIRIDQVIGNNLVIFGRYSNAPSRSDLRGDLGRSFNTINRFKVNSRTLTAGATWSISTKTNNDLRWNWSRSTGSTRFILDTFGGAVVPSDTILFPPFVSAEESAFTFLPLGPSNGGWAKGKNADNFQRQINLVDTLSLAAGAHALKFGFDYRRIFPIFDQLKYSLAPIFFSGFATMASATADLTVLFSETGVRYPVFNNYSVFAQDTWRSNPRLTLTYGLRWDVNPPPFESKGNNPFAVTGVDNAATLALAPRGTPLFKTTYSNFAPRIGVTYLLRAQPGHETVLRGAWGVFYDLGTGQIANAFIRFPYNALRFPSRLTFPIDPALIAPPQVNLTPPITDSINVPDPNLKLPRIYQWNVAVEQSLGSNQTITASYVGAAGRRLLRQEQLRNSILTNVRVTKNTATSDYHAMQLQFNRRLSRGLQAVASYTWSHSIDINSADSATNLTVTRIDPRQDRGPSDFDVRHSFSGALTYNLPRAKRETWRSKLVGKWATDFIFRARSPLPVNVVTGQALFEISSPPVGRPDLVVGVPLYLYDSSLPGGRKFNRAALAVPPNTRQGNLGRNVFRGFGASQLDLALRRELSLTERIKLQFRAEFFNLFNHPNFGDPGSAASNTNLLSNPSFGLSTTTLSQSLGGGGLNGGFSSLYQIGGPRSIQLSAKIQF